MRRRISLDGAWERHDFLDEAWRWSDALRAPMSSTDGPPIHAGVSGGWRPAQVPGSAIDDAWRAREIPNPYVDRNSLAAEWIPQRTWLYRRRVLVPEPPSARPALVFDGIDPGGAVFLDGEEVARHSGMFVPLEVELTADVGPGEHDVVVVVDPAPPMPSQVGRTEEARHHRSRMGYGWDFCPRMINTGIWRSVWLDLRDSAWLGRPQLETSVDGDHRRATIRVRCDVRGDASDARVTATVRDDHGVAVTTADALTSVTPATLELEVAEPALWWPNGSGVPALYRLELVLERHGEVLDREEVRFGIRTLETVRPVDSAADALPYTLVINGEATWMRGWNWVPLDAAYGVPRPDRLRHLIELARRANVNLLRVWGGGLIESNDFYDACDEAGIMVWQEFAQSSSGVSNTPAEDAAFVDLMRREAEAILPLRRNHPSLVLWCGGNELTDAAGKPLDESHPVLAALREVVAREDPGRAWLPTSPSGPRFDNTLAGARAEPGSLHDVHGPWEHQGLAEQHELADATTSLLHSEFGAEGMTSLETLTATVSEEARRPADHRNPVMAHRGPWWNNEPFVQRAFGGGLDLAELERASQHLQADGLRTLVDGDRRRWPTNAGAIPWQLNESFPNAWCTSAVDYFGVPKAAYHAVADAYAAAAVGTSFASQALGHAPQMAVTPWVANATRELLGGSLRLALRDSAGRVLAEAAQRIEVELQSVRNGLPTTLDVPGDASDLLLLDATFEPAGAQPRSTRRVVSRTATLEPMRRLPPASVVIDVTEPEPGSWLVGFAASGPTIALELRLRDARPVGWPERAGSAWFEANFLTLLPGEERSVRVEWCDVPADERRIRVSGWNVAERVLTVV